MVKKVFALASVTALAGLIVSTAAAGCSSTTTVTDEGGTADTGVKIPDASRPDTSDGPDTAPPKCVQTGPFDTSTVPFFTPAKPQVGVCTTADYTAIETFVAAGSLNNFDDLKTVKGVSAACLACAFTTGATTPWGPYVDDAVAGATDAVQNTGGCVAYVSGSDTLGKDWAEYNDCLQQACEKNCTDSTTFSDCLQNDAPAQCTTQLTKFETDAGGQTPAETILTACDDAVKSATLKYELEVYVYYQCTADLMVLGDGGADAGK